MNPSHVAPPQRPSPLAPLPAAVRRYRIFAPLALLATIPAQAAGGRIRNLFVKEDSLVEMSTAAFFLLAFVLAASFQLGDRARRLASRGLVLALGAIGLAGCLDELSFGQRIFRFTTPRIGRLNLDGFHDLIQITQHTWRFGDGAVRATMLVVTTLLALAAWRLLRTRRAAMATWWRANRRHPATFFMLAAVAQVGLAMTVDLHFVRFPGISLMEEMLELNGALALALAIWSLSPSPATAAPTKISLTSLAA